MPLQRLFRMVNKKDLICSVHALYVKHRKKQKKDTSMIKEDRRRKKPFVLYTRDGSRILGTHSTYASALRQERAIQANSRKARKNPFNAVEDFEHMIESLSDKPRKIKALMAEYYPFSVNSPAKFIKDNPLLQVYKGKHFCWLGEAGSVLKLDADIVVPREDNEFDYEKLAAVACAPEVYSFQIPFRCGFVHLKELDCCDILEAMDDASLFPYYTPDSDDVGLVYAELRDGNHRALGALLSGEPFIYAQLSTSDLDEYKKWLAEGKLASSSNPKLRFIDENLI